mgnify:CR=1 FL=1
MGNVEKFVLKHEKEKHKTTEEFIDTLLWYARASAEIDKEWAEAKSNINEAFNQRMAEIRKGAEDNA